jgi:hypothetical protein
MSFFSQLAQGVYHQIYWNGHIDWLLLITTLLVLVALLGTIWIVSWLIYSGLDYMLGTPSQLAQGHVVGFDHEPSHTNLVSMWNGTTNTLIPITTPESFEVRVLVDSLGQTADVGVSKELYENLTKGEVVTVRYSHGLWSKTLYATIVRHHH